jgi:membrane protease YdiL (CAAX protease family)
MSKARRAWCAPALGVGAAIAITSSLDASRYSDFSSHALAPLLLVAALWQRCSRRELGFTLARPSEFALALALPLVGIGAAALAAWLGGALSLASFAGGPVLRQIALYSLATAVIALVTEEGFFRGWLWASLERAGASPRGRVALTTAAFAVWHISVAVFDTGFELPARQVPIYIANAALIGGAWGVLRARSGSVLVTSLCHGLWNGLAYTLFGFGEQVGALGVERTSLFGPEVGVLGVAWNSLILGGLWASSLRARRATS